MAAVSYTVRLDEADKKAAEQVFNELGLTLAAGVNVYIKAVVRQQRIPFEMTLTAPPDEKLTPAQRRAAHDFLNAMQTIRNDGFSADDENAINDLQTGKYKPTFKERLRT